MQFVEYCIVIENMQIKYFTAFEYALCIEVAQACNIKVFTSITDT